MTQQQQKRTQHCGSDIGYLGEPCAVSADLLPSAVPLWGQLRALASRSEAHSDTVQHSAPGLRARKLRKALPSAVAL